MTVSELFAKYKGKTVDWDDVAENEDDYITKGKKMAEALINTKQKFIVP